MTHTASSEVPVVITDEPRFGNMDTLAPNLLQSVVALSGGGTLDQRIDMLTSVMLTEPQVQCDVIHRFGPGLYIREINVPAGTMGVGHYQRYEHLNILLKGKVTMLKDDGSTSTLEAPMMFVGKPGRKVGIIEEDMIWQNIYATTETDIEKLEEMFFDKSEIWDEHIAGPGQKLLQSDFDQNEYLEMLAEIGVTEDFVRSESERTDNMIDLPYGAYKIKVGDSPINGKGLFATANITTGEVIAPGRIGDRRTIAGRYTNHSNKPNATVERVGAKGINLVALSDIAGCAGGHDGDEITIDYRESVMIAIQINKEN